MSKLHQIAGALMATVVLHGNAVPQQAPAANDTSTVREIDVPTLPAPMVLNCKTQGQWKSIPSDDFAQFGNHLCTDQNFQTALPEAGTSRNKYLAQLTLAHRHLSQLAQLGRPVQGGDLTDINLPNLFVAEKPNASSKGGIVYQFELTIRQPVTEGGSPLAEEQLSKNMRTGKLTGLLEVNPAAKSSLARSTL